MKLAIIGSRTIGSVDIASHLKHIPDTIVSSGAVGVNTLAREFARKHGLKMIEFLPNYKLHGGSTAPLERNKLIVQECDCLLAFWDGKSRGTKFTFEYAEKPGKPVKVVKVNV